MSKVVRDSPGLFTVPMITMTEICTMELAGEGHLLPAITIDIRVQLV